MLKFATKFIPVPEAFQCAADAGFRYAEFWTDAKVLAGWESVVDWAQQHDMQYAIHFPNRADLSRESLVHLVEMHRALNCSAVVIHGPMHRRYAAAVAEISDSVPLAIENLKLDRDEFWEWVESRDRLTLDVEHLWKFTLRDAPLDTLFQEIRRLLATHVDKVQHIHLPGYVAGGAEHQPMCQSPEMCCGVFDLLAEYGYDKLVVSEVNEPFQNVDDLRRDMEFCQSWHDTWTAKGPQSSRPAP